MRSMSTTSISNASPHYRYWSVCVYVSVYMWVYIYVCVYVVRMCVCPCVYVCMSVCARAYTYRAIHRLERPTEKRVDEESDASLCDYLREEHTLTNGNHNNTHLIYYRRILDPSCNTFARTKTLEYFTHSLSLTYITPLKVKEYHIFTSNVNEESAELLDFCFIGNIEVNLSLPSAYKSHSAS